MSIDDKKDPWAELMLGEARPFVDPVTGEMVMEQPVLGPGKRKAVDAGYVMLSMDAMAVAVRYLGGPAMLILMEAARQWRMGNGSVAITSGLAVRLGLTRRQRLGAVADLVKLGEGTGWVKVTRASHRAARVQMTTAGMRKVWRLKSAGEPEI